MKPCVFFDRDGIVNRPPTRARYVRHWREFELVPEFLDVLRAVAEHGYEAVIVTNQRGITTGQMTQQDVDEIHRNLADTLRRHHLGLLDILVCPADDDRHPHRKPNPGMLLEAARRHQLDLDQSWMVGDSEKDVEAGRRAGCRTILVAAGHPETRADHVVRDMAELARFFGEHLGDVSRRGAACGGSFDPAGPAC